MHVNICRVAICTYLGLCTCIWSPHWETHSLTQDMAELEEAVGGHLLPPATLGRPFRVLRGFRTLLFAGEPAPTHCALARSSLASRSACHRHLEMIYRGSYGKWLFAQRLAAPLRCPETTELVVPGNAAVAGTWAVAAVHHMYSRGPAELQSPMSRAGLTPAQASIPVYLSAYFV